MVEFKLIVAGDRDFKDYEKARALADILNSTQ